jgi:predicted ATP-dependent endonuclease of OLD family
MKIERIQIRNFRILEDIEVDIEDNLSVVIGKNNTGKTSFLSILEKFLAPGKPEFVFDDFSILEQKRICGLENTEHAVGEYDAPLLSLKLYISYSGDDDISSASEFLLDLDVEKHYFVVLLEYVLPFEKYSNLVTDYNEHKTNVSGRNFRDFVARNISRYFTVRIRALEYGNEKNLKDISLETVNKVISMQTIGAKRDVDNEQGRGKSLSTLANRYYRNIGSDMAFPQLQQTLIETDEKLTAEYKTIFSSVVDEIKEMSYNPAEAEISIISSLTDRPLFQDNTIVKYQHDDTLLPEDYNGLGYLNLFAIMFEIRIKLDKLVKKNIPNERPTPINLLFVEEPEAHTHPQMQYVFIMNIKQILTKQIEDVAGFSLQTLISTHSAHIASQCDFQDIKYFYRVADEANRVKERSLKSLYTSMVTATDEEAQEKEEQEKAFRFVKQYVTLHRSEMFFADKVILIEGDTERMLLSAMMKKYDDEKKTNPRYVPLLSQNISIVEVGAYAQVFSIFLDFIGAKTLIFTDLDCATINANNRAEGCPFTEANTTTNASIKQILGTNDISVIVSKTADERTLSFDNEQRSWQQDTEGYLRLAFQCNENGYQPSSFEDAFFCCNLNFLIENKDAFRGLKCRDDLVVGATDYYVLANKCINTKTTFALDILINGGDDNEKWSTPKYIKEGLEWLSM